MPLLVCSWHGARSLSSILLAGAGGPSSIGDAESEAIYAIEWTVRK